MTHPWVSAGSPFYEMSSSSFHTHMPTASLREQAEPIFSWSHQGKEILSDE